MISVLIGPANSGKTRRLIARVADAVAARQRGVHLIVPSAAAARISRESLNDNVSRLPLDAVKTFPALYRAILEKANSTLHWLNSIERSRVLRFVIAELAQSQRFDYFAETAAMPGFVNMLGSFIEELWRSGVTPENFAGIAEKRSDKDRDIARVFAAYAAALTSLDAVDAESAGQQTLAIIEQASQPQRWFSLIAIDGFDFLTAVQVGVLSRLAERGVEAVVSLTYDETRAIHYWQRPTIARLQTVGATFLQCAVEPGSRIQSAANALMHEDNLAAVAVAGSMAESYTDSEISIISAPDRATEVRSVAREIKRLAMACEVSLDDIVIICRAHSFYAHHIERIFAECEIPVTLDVPLAITKNPAIVALLRLLNLSGKSFSRRACFETWRSPYFDWSAFGLDERVIDLLDAISLAENVLSGRDQWRVAVTGFAEKRHREQIRAEFDAHEDLNLEALIERYGQLAENLDHCFVALTPRARATREAHFAWVSQLIERLKVDERAASGDTALRDGRALQEFHRILAALSHNDFTKRLAKKSDDLSGDEITWPVFVSEVERTLSEITYDRNPVSRPCVVVQEAHRMHPRPYRAVFVLGLIEGEFPARMSEPAPYSLAEREGLRRAGVDWTETINDAGADLLQFNKAMSRARERLYLTFARTDIAGGELLPSYLIEEIQPFITSPTRRIGSASACEAGNLSDASSLEELAIRTAQANRGLESAGASADRSASRAVNDLLDARLPSWRMTRRGVEAEGRRSKSASRDGYSGWIVDQGRAAELRKRFGPQHMWSASQINDYGICPFRFFAKHTLKLVATEEPGEGFAAHHLGRAYHRILEDLYTQLRKRDEMMQSPTAAQAIAEAARITDAVLKKMLDDGEVRRDGMWEANKDEIKRRVGRLLHREALWNDELPVRPLHCECKFGMGDVEPLIIDCAGGEARFCGIVDRIDRRDNGEWVVVDYKTRRTPIPIKDAIDGRNLQLPIYAMAASRVIDKQASVASAYYLHINSRKRGSQLSKEGNAATSLDQLIEQAEDRIRYYVEQIRQGSFPIQPNGNAVCQSCDYDVMCRIQSLRASEDAQDHDE